MANQLIVAGTVTLNVDGIKNTFNIGQMGTTDLTGSNLSVQSQNMTSSGWTGLFTQSLSDYRFGAFYNDASASQVTLSSTGSGTTTLVVMQPYDIFLLPGTGSIASNQLYGKVTGGTGQTATLQYQLTES